MDYKTLVLEKKTPFLVKRMIMQTMLNLNKAIIFQKIQKIQFKIRQSILKISIAWTRTKSSNKTHPFQFCQILLTIRLSKIKAIFKNLNKYNNNLLNNKLYKTLSINNYPNNNSFNLILKLKVQFIKIKVMFHKIKIKIMATF